MISCVKLQCLKKSHLHTVQNHLVLSEIGYFLTTFSLFTGREPMSIPKASTNFAFATLSDMALAAKKLSWPSWRCQEFWH